MMDQKSPEFRVGAFIQDIENLKSTLDTLDIVYQVETTPLEVKSEGRYHAENVDIPKFHLTQFLGRICMMLDELQARFAVQDNEGLVPLCKVHGAKPPAMVVEGMAFCLLCLANGPFADYACGWTDPENEMPERKEELS